jgi:CheY-like chemotaxis protein
MGLSGTDRTAGSSGDLRPFTILIVEDHDDARDVLRLMVEHMGATALTAQGGEEALECLRRSKVHLMLCDLGMPVMNGYALRERLQRDHGLSGLPVVAVSAYVTPEDKRRVAEAGFNGHLAKPVNFRALENEMRRILLPG